MSDYRDSGIEQIGLIPSQWGCAQISRVLEDSAVGIMVGPFGSSLTNAVVGPEEGQYKIYGQANLIRKDFSYGDKYVTEQKYRELCNYEVVPGDIAVSMMGTIGKCRVIPEGIKKGIMDSHLIKLRLKKCMSPYYFEYVYESPAVFDQITAKSKGSIMTGLNSSIVKSLYIPIPGKEEQNTIVDYLDKYVVLVDSLIDEAKASIEEYKAWKASIIYEAVTKGLDKNVEMKDSGVEWIGFIPESWSMKRIKNVSEFMPKCDFSQISNTDEITFTPMECIRTGCFENRKKTLGEIEGSYTQYADGDIVIAKVTPCFENKNICIMKGLYSGLGLGSSELFVLRPNGILDRFLFYFLQHQGFIDSGCASMTGTGGLKRVSSVFLRDCGIPVPDQQTQVIIADYLDQKSERINKLIDEKESLISDLEAYKKSLIFEVVTGKRKVV